MLKKVKENILTVKVHHTRWTPGQAGVTDRGWVSRVRRKYGRRVERVRGSRVDG